jgi:hypothetical protein
MNHLLVITLAVAMSACIDLKKRDTEDRRTGRETPDAGQPVTPPSDAPPKDTAPPAKPVLVPADGRYGLTEFVCPGNKREAATNGMVFVAAGDDARFEQALTSTCDVFQKVTRVPESGGVRLDFGETHCEGVCNNTCRKQLVAEIGTQRSYKHTLKSGGGFELSESGTSFPAACGGKQPVGLHFAPREPRACVKRWTVTGQTPADTLLVLDGDLKWSTGPLSQGEARTLSQDGLSGDFTVTVRYSDFATEDRGGYFRLALTSIADPKSYAHATVASHTDARGGEPTLVAAIGTTAAYEESVNATVVARTARAGELIIKRRGLDLSVIAKDADGNAAERALPADATFAAGPYRLAIELGNNSNLTPSIPATGISVQDVIVNDSRLDVLPASDRFECDSIEGAR